MSDATPPPDDELVSAHLDGEATPAESARVVGDPAWAARARELAVVQELVAAPVAPPPATREASIGAALALYDQLDVSGTTSADPGTAPPPIAAAPQPSTTDDELAARRADTAARARRASRNGAILAVAAVVVVALLGLGAVLRLQTSKSADTALSSAAAPSTTARNGTPSGAASPKSESGSSEDQTQADANASSPATTAPPAAAQPTSTVTAPVTTVAPTAPGAAQRASAAEAYRFQEQSLGTFATPAQVRAGVISTLAGRATTETTSPSVSGADSAAAGRSLADVQRCDATIRASDDEVGPIVLSAPAGYKGTGALVLVYSIDRSAHPAANGGSRIYTVDATSCAVLDVQTG